QVNAGATLQWSVTHKGQPVITPSIISLITDYGDTIGANPKVISAKVETTNELIPALHYKKDTVVDNYSQLTITCKGDYGVIFRAYNDGVAYRFFTKMSTSLVMGTEQANFNFADDDSAYVAYSNDPHEGDKFQTSFENLYQHIKLSQFVKDTVAFAPVLVELPGGKKAVITEADLEDYPGMFLQAGPGNNLHGTFAPYVLETKPNPQNDAQVLVRKRAGYIAKTTGTRTFPWRVVIISESDKDLLNNDMVYKLASPSRVDDVSWIKPGKVSWDWWNDWNISHVPFRAGINTDTYKFYIDFAAANHLEYILMDAGWSDGKSLMKIIPGIDLPAIIDYAKQKNVGVWLWAGSQPMNTDMDEVLDYYAKLGVKGFKVDFMDRDDQAMVNFFYTLAQKAADHHLMIDYHGAYKPTGLQRTYPNVMNFEGVRGLENAKWSPADMPPYDVTIPFIRMLAGPMDYTPGAMKNANKRNFNPVYSAPMSQGTRCHQLAMYVVYEAPFEMLSDNPNNYMKEQECTNFIASVPTVFNQTVALDSKVGKYAAIARRSGTNWFVGAMGDWDAHDITIDLSFLGSGNYEAEIFKDGVNADREATDYSREVIKVTATDKLPVHLSTGGGWAARIYPANN
ncbi:MAG TPA: glycoside hydrolase family 97 protein, partial [Chitinophagaceae bacterium]|nr:glycoside hydrolase family 97 protein [Chitinophagaceae bacterium]